MAITPVITIGVVNPDGSLLTGGAPVGPAPAHVIGVSGPAGESLAAHLGFANPMTTPGDLILGGTAGVPTRLSKGADSQVLTVDPTTHLPVWAAAGGGGGTAITGSGGTVDADAAGGILATPASGKGFRVTVPVDGDISIFRDNGSGGWIMRSAHGDFDFFCEQSYADLTLSQAGVAQLTGGLTSPASFQVAADGTLVLTPVSTKPIVLQNMPIADPSVIGGVWDQGGKLLALSGFNRPNLSATSETTDNIVAALVSLGLVQAA